jgi:hypothetical protein
MIKFPQTKIEHSGKRVDRDLNTIWILKDQLGSIDFGFLVDLLEDIESWRTCLDEIELGVKSHYKFTQFNSDEDELDDNNETITQY